mmetsp:Transcript_44989/g.83450  ORF Transcript_44989/g.83450 Transcript_44989/m.83450 type:complete len:283 (+) Transcript_44989:571-1419(+)
MANAVAERETLAPKVVTVTVTAASAAAVLVSSRAEGATVGPLGTARWRRQRRRKSRMKRPCRLHCKGLATARTTTILVRPVCRRLLRVSTPPRALLLLGTAPPPPPPLFFSLLSVEPAGGLTTSDTACVEKATLEVGGLPLGKVGLTDTLKSCWCAVSWASRSKMPAAPPLMPLSGTVTTKSTSVSNKSCAFPLRCCVCLVNAAKASASCSSPWPCENTSSESAPSESASASSPTGSTPPCLSFPRASLSFAAAAAAAAAAPPLAATFFAVASNALRTEKGE